MISPYLTPLVTILLVLVAVDRIQFTGKSRKERPASKTSAALFIVPAIVYVIIYLAAYWEQLYVVNSLKFYPSFVGSLLLLLGIWARNKAMRSLGYSWSPHIDPKDGGRVVRSGVYRYSRHPYSLSVVLELCGWCLFLNSYRTLGLVFIVQIPLLVLRSWVEEKSLTAKFHDEYTQYRKETPILPCLSRGSIYGFCQSLGLVQAFDLLRLVGIRGCLRILIAHRRMLRYVRSYMVFHCLIALGKIGFFDEIKKTGNIHLIEYAKKKSLDFEVLKPVCEYLYQVRILNRTKKGYSLSLEGKMLADASVGAFELTYAYAPIFENLNSLLTGNLKYNLDIFRREPSVAKGSTALTRLLPFPAAKEIIARHGFGSIADLGCGDAELLLYLSDGLHVRGVGIDSSASVVNDAKKKIKHAGCASSVQVFQGDISQPESFKKYCDKADVISAMFVLHEFFYGGFHHGVEILSRLKRTFPDKHFLICELTRKTNSELRRRKTTIAEHHLFHRLSQQGIVSKSKWRDVIGEAGFKILEERNYDFAGQSYYLLR